jgi:hypothetical protein
VKRLVAVALALAAAPVAAREYDVRVVIDDVDDLYELNVKGELTDEDLELLVALYHRPLDINRADRYLLFDLPEVTYELADAIVAYRAEHGAFPDVYDLRRVAGMTDDIFDSLRPFVVVSATTSAAPGSDVRGAARLGYFRQDELGDETRDVNVITFDAPNAYLQLEATGFTHFGMGALFTLRPMVSPVWNYSLGTLSGEPGNSFNLEGLNAYVNYDMWRAVVGHYNVGFGEKLTFDTTGREHPNSWDERLTPTQRREDGDVRPKRSLRGAALSIDGADLPVGWVDATAFFSYQDNDLYQYDMWYEPDEFFMSSGACDTDGDCPSGYTCRPDHTCTSSYIADQRDDGESLSFATIEDGFTETIIGGRGSFNLDERTHLGVTAYRSEIAFNFGEPGAPNFSLSAQYPRYPVFGAVGVDGSVGLGPAELAGEVSSTFEGDLAGVLRAVVDPTDWAEIQWSLRAYGRDYENPHSRGTSSRLEVFGSTRRAQQGTRLEVLLKPMPRMKLRTSVDLYRTPWSEQFDEEGTLVWEDDPVAYLRFSERISYGPTSKEDVSLQLDYSDNDLSEGGRDERYVSDSRSSSTFERQPGRGERRATRLSVRTERLPFTAITVAYTAGFEDNALGTELDLEQKMNFAISSKPWEGGVIRAAGRIWVDDEVTDDDWDRVFTISLKQRIHERLSLQLSWGVLGEQYTDRDTDEQFYDYEQFGFIQAESRF